jgi:ribosome-associated heat shock protein Hsp15
MRIDQWLWAVRVYKTRSIAAEAIKGGHVKVNGERTKPAHEPKPGEQITARIGIMTRTVKFLAAPKSRVAAKLVPEFAEDLTPPEEYEKRRESNLIPIAFRPKGAGRPTKRERRELDAAREDPLD